jgi:hypothetical protein
MFYIVERNSMTILSSLITSKMRIYILMRLFLNASEEAQRRTCGSWPRSSALPPAR